MFATLYFLVFCPPNNNPFYLPFSDLPHPPYSCTVPSTLESPVNHRVRFHSISSDHLRGARRPSSAPSLDSSHHQSLFAPRYKNSSSSSTTSSQHYDSVNESSNGSEDDDTSKNNEKNAFYSSTVVPNPNTSLHSESFSQSYSDFPAYCSTPNKDLFTTANGSTLQYSTSFATPLVSSPAVANSPNNQSPKLLLDEHKENTPPFTPGMHPYRYTNKTCAFIV